MGRRHGNRRGGRPILAGVFGILLAGLASAEGLAAQQPIDERGEIDIEAGTRVRITTSSSPDAIVGVINALEPESVQLVEETNNTVVTISRDEIRRIEHRVQRSAGRQATPGMVAGGLLGLVVGVVTTEDAEDVDCDPRSPLCIDLDLPSNKVMAGFAGLMIGTIGGGLISWALVPGESWEDAPLPALTTGADSNGAYLAFRIPLRFGGRQ